MELSPQAFLTILSLIGGLTIFLVRHLFNEVTTEIHKLREDISKINITLAINSHAIKYLSDELKK